VRPATPRLAGAYYNSVFTDFAVAGVDVEDLPSGEDSQARMDEGTLKLANNIWWGFGAGNDLAGVADCSGDGCADDTPVQNHLAANNNRIVDPLLRGVSRTTDQGLDPRPLSNSPALSGAATPPADGFYRLVGYVGAFGPTDSDLWIDGWTFISELGIVVQGVIPTVISHESAVDAVPNGFELHQNSPNPFNSSTTIRYSVPLGGEVKLAVYNTVGQQVATLIEGFRAAGTYDVSLDAADLSSGTYFYRIESASGTQTRSMMLLK
jgi:type IX secretion system substrate protein